MKNTVAQMARQKRIPKKIRALKILLQRSLIQPEAHNLYGETCLHTVISQLSNDHGLGFDRKSEVYGVHRARFMRYRLQDAYRKAAELLVGKYEVVSHE